MNNPTNINFATATPAQLAAAGYTFQKLRGTKPPGSKRTATKKA